MRAKGYGEHRENNDCKINMSKAHIKLQRLRKHAWCVPGHLDLYNTAFSLFFMRILSV